MKKNLGIFIITILILFTSMIPCFAINMEELQEKQNEINTQIENKNEQLTEVQTEISATLQKISELGEEISKYEIEVEELTKDTEELRISVKDLESKLEIAEESYEKQKKLVEERLLVIYESADTTYLDVLLNSKSFSEFISTYFYLTEIVNNDTAILQDLDSERKKIEADKEALAEEKEKLKTARNNMARTTITLENTKVLQNEYKNKLTEEEKTIEAELEQYENELKQIQAEIIAYSRLELDGEYSGGIMAWPVPGYTRITSPYGIRFHPIFHVYRMHNGIDIGAPTGTYIISTNDGVVIKATYNDSYGNMVVVDHGGGISTVYGHGSEILVTVGQVVKRGEPIMKVGSTGWSTGPHLHYEVRVDGNPVQPMNFLKKQTTDETTENNTNSTNENNVTE